MYYDWFFTPLLLVVISSFLAYWLGRKEGMEARQKGPDPVIKRSLYFKLLATGAIISIFGWISYWNHFGSGWDLFCIYCFYNILPVSIMVIYGLVANHFAYGKDPSKKWYQAPTDWLCITFHFFLIIIFPIFMIWCFGANPFSWFNPKLVEIPNFLSPAHS